MSIPSPTITPTRDKTALTLKSLGWEHMIDEPARELWTLGDDYVLTAHYRPRPGTVTAIELAYRVDGQTRHIHVTREGTAGLRGKALGGIPAGHTIREHLLMVAEHTDLLVWLHEEAWWNTAQSMAEHERVRAQNVSPAMSNAHLSDLGRDLGAAADIIRRVDGTNAAAVAEAAATARQLVDQITAALSDQ